MSDYASCLASSDLRVVGGSCGWFRDGFVGHHERSVMCRWGCWFDVGLVDGIPLILL
ncbi:hypothetical protein [Marinomonas sp.]|uniref:hypothetical protein n=1 Tax=Marinomonas sp. TaxID=1904862 RepID=UPI003A8F1544